MNNELIEFANLVAAMRDAQDAANRALAQSDDYSEALIYVGKAEECEREVDFALKTILKRED